MSIDYMERLEQLARRNLPVMIGEVKLTAKYGTEKRKWRPCLVCGEMRLTTRENRNCAGCNERIARIPHHAKYMV